MVDTVAGAYAPHRCRAMIEGFGAAVIIARPRCAPTRLEGNRRGHCAALDAASIAHRPSLGTQMPSSCPGPRFPTCRTSTSIATARSTFKVCQVHDAATRAGRSAGEDILDMCAAPGKTTQIAALTQGQAHLTACEMSIPRAEKLESNLTARVQKRARHASTHASRTSSSASIASCSTPLHWHGHRHQRQREKPARPDRAAAEQVRPLAASTSGRAMEPQTGRHARLFDLFDLAAGKRGTPCKRPSIRYGLRASSPRWHAERK